MKKTSAKKEAIKTMPKGIWESSKPKTSQDCGQSSCKTDLQGNGYPDSKKK